MRAINLEAPRVCIVSETLAARLWPGQEAIGKRVALGNPNSGADDWMQVIGVVRDVRHQALERAAGPDIYKPTLQLAWKQLHFLVRAQPGVEPMSLIPSVQRQIAGDRAGSRRV